MNNLIYSNNKNSESSCLSSSKEFNLRNLKNNTLNSLNEVEYFLNNFHKFTNYVKLYKILR